MRLAGAAEVLTVEVTDDGQGPNGTRPAGYGLVGMRERVAVYGGSLEHRARRRRRVPGRRPPALRARIRA